MIVRRATSQDAEAFVRAHEVSWDASIAPIVGRQLGELAPFEARVESFHAGMAATPENAGAWVADVEGAIVGIAIRIGDELRDLYVVPSAWGTGVAKALMDAALEDVSGEAFLWVGEENTRARRFYEREGWAADGESRASPLGPAELRYRKALA
jgi:GNAT superfamily N-acetyltransferase